MRCLSAALVAAVFIWPTIVSSQQPETEEQSTPPTQATFLITGLHCPPCTRTVEASLRQIKGVRAVKVDWRTKNARIEFDEAVLPAQLLAQSIATTPHMMGGTLHYGGWLALKVPGITDEASGQRAQEALSKVKGIKRVAVYPAQNSLGILFAPEGAVTSQQLIEALKEASFEASNYQP